MTTGYEELQMDFMLWSDFEDKMEDEIQHWQMPSNVHGGENNPKYVCSVKGFKLAIITREEIFE